MNIAFTIVTKNYIAGALVWKKSLKENSPEVLSLIYVTDLAEKDIASLFDEITETAPRYAFPDRSNLCSLESVEVPDKEMMMRRYTTIEFCTAIKPSLFLSLSKKYPGTIIHYFDPDILVCGNLNELLLHSEKHSFTLTPHIQTPTDDSLRLGVLDIMRAGVFNFGYLGWNPSFQSGFELMIWWSKQLVDNCRVALSEGIFVDQSWGVLFCCSPESGIFHSKSYNVAYWNLHERFIGYDNEKKYLVNGSPLHFFHFSGFDFKNPEQLSIHQNRHYLPGNRTLKTLFESYAAQLSDAGIMHWTTKYNQAKPGEPPKKAGKLTSIRELAMSHTEWYIKALLGNPYHALLKSAILWWIFYPLNALVLLLFVRGKKLKATKALQQKLHEAGSVVVENIKEKHSHNYIYLSLAFWVAVLKKTISEPKVLLGNECGFEELPPSSSLTNSVDNTISGREIAVTGYLTGEMGVGESVRGLTRAMEHCGYEADLFDIRNHYARSQDEEFSNKVSVKVGKNLSYKVSLLCVNADQVARIIESQPGFVHTISDRRIGYWYWETEVFPQRFVSAAQYFDEIWVATNFVRNALRHAGIDKPIRVIPPAIPASPAQLQRVSEHGCWEDSGTGPTFLCVFDATSILGRKNPGGAIQLIRKIQQSTNINPTLILKTTHLGEANRTELLKMAEGIEVRIIDQYLSKTETMALISSADCYVSLHRAEGLGLSLIDAMQLGTPLLSTNYSGPVDFANDSNAWMVPWKYTDANWGDGPYYGSRWADPDLDAACAQAISLLEDKDGRLLKTRKAKADIKNHFSCEKISALVKEALG
jgi:glycosyltransferase involved in cell wall biosynthesis